MNLDQSAPGIYTVIQTCLDRGEQVEDLVLPDEDDSATTLRFAPGAMDGIVGHHGGGGQEPDAAVADLFAAIESACAVGADRLARTDDDGSPDHVDRLDRLARDPNLIALVDPLLRRVRDRSATLDNEALHALALRLARTSAHRGPVKLGIALLGLFAVPPHREVLLTLGQHEEFTLYATVALRNGQDDADDDLWWLAQRVRGWGRIHLVERLCATNRADILDWILREGFRNSVMDEYLAYRAATSADLLARLRGDVDDDLLYAAGDLLAALFAGGPAEDIHDYADGATVAATLVDLLSQRASDLRHLGAIIDILGFAAGPEPDAGWPEGWSVALRGQLATGCQEILDRPHWIDVARQGLEERDRTAFWRADRACSVLGIPTLPVLLRRLRTEPAEASLWYAALRQANVTSIDDILDLAVTVLPLAEIATGPAEELGMGPRFALYSSLDHLLSTLNSWPGKGWPLVAAGLASPVIRNRNLAVQVLASWPRQDWPEVAEPALRAALQAEPTDTVREGMAQVLDGNGQPGPS